MFSSDDIVFVYLFEICPGRPDGPRFRNWSAPARATRFCEIFRWISAASPRTSRLAYSRVMVSIRIRSPLEIEINRCATGTPRAGGLEARPSVIRSSRISDTNYYILILNYRLLINAPLIYRFATILWPSMRGESTPSACARHGRSCQQLSLQRVGGAASGRPPALARRHATGQRFETRESRLPPNRRGNPADPPAPSPTRSAPGRFDRGTGR